jgi:hypothetical protein
MKKYFSADDSSNSIGGEPTNNMDWLCGLTFAPFDLTNQIQVNTCSINTCRLYTDWSAWSSCTKVCGGITSRSRSCAPNVNCDTNFLYQTKSCGLDDCDSIILSIHLAKYKLNSIKNHMIDSYLTLLI